MFTFSTEKVMTIPGNVEVLELSSTRVNMKHSIFICLKDIYHLVKWDLATRVWKILQLNYCLFLLFPFILI